MTMLDAHAEVLRARAGEVRLPKPSTVLVTLIGLIPFLLGWVLNAAWQLLTVLYAACLKGWETGQKQMGPSRAKGPGG